jgi:hypothetical protein
VAEWSSCWVLLELWCFGSHGYVSRVSHALVEVVLKLKSFSYFETILCSCCVVCVGVDNVVLPVFPCFVEFMAM